ncbi:MAG: hypothetical protein SGI74_07770 [Oligoflexia bacterium]|nr:hypothetical protein [Oligoflexia bacterium]
MRRNFGHCTFSQHITGNTKTTDWWDFTLPQVWLIFAEVIKTFAKGNVQFNAFVLMSNHFEVGLVFRAEDYQLSTLGILLGRFSRPFPVIDNMGLITDPIRMLRWLNNSNDVSFWFSKSGRS